ncbi:hypothetical protein [Chryseobacterium sp. JUb7]|uniref:hypothetical protein n=1 Tax=Chryseobacterium sp. JUb7 TaxID=2940599 RepID=UPI00216A65D9|nr:hypothetical protein [Chryseobacterium sp. JUb7]MCS3530468.1 hypothetical protein [Chryseobacterium sp. JUb7]
MEKLYIPNPCSENWESMSFQEKGRFCSVCNKCVIDFTQKNKDEIKSIFAERKEENICGRYYSHQLTNRVNMSEQIKRYFFKYIPSNLQSNKIALTVFSVLLFWTGCSKSKDEVCITTEETVIEDIELDTAQNKNYVIGEAVIREDKQTAKRLLKDSIQLKQNQKK